MDRFDVILAAGQRVKVGQSLSGRKSPASAMCKVLEEVCALYSWDRPAIHSPVKKGKKAEHKLGNCVVIVTKLPEDLTEVDKQKGEKSVQWGVGHRLAHPGHRGRSWGTEGGINKPF